MKVPISWLKEYMDITVPADELARRLTMAGTEVSDVAAIGGWKSCYVGLVTGVEPHPNADRLTLPTVALGGGETATVVCGAPNVAAGQKIAFAHEGAMLFSARSKRVGPLKAANIRGVKSAGMVCSALELGIGEDHHGILVLDDEAAPGTPLVDYLGDSVLDLEVTPNRPDCLSVLGVAHEVAALTGGSVAEPDLSYPEEGGAVEDHVSVEIADPGLCSRYAASVITGIRVGPSPRWLQDALERAGQRPISNIVDVTNYVMIEYGQPLHAFDLDKVKDSRIVVRPARPGETLAMLDGETREMAPPMLTIADAHDAVALAGVMGGSGTAVSEGTVNILIESANFDPVNTRRTAGALRLSTEASHRFERGIRAELVPRALRRATQLMLEVAGGKACRGIVDAYLGRKHRPPAWITQRRVKQVMGVDFDAERVGSTLVSLGFEPAGDSGEGGMGDGEQGWELQMRVPYWRSDIAIEEDLIEEVARIVGYDEVPTTTLSTPIPYPQRRPREELREKLRDALAAAGMYETISYPLTSMETLEDSGALADVPEPLRVANPMSSRMQVLRTSLRGSMLETLASNLRVSSGKALRLFEIGSVYLPRDEAKEKDLPEEREVVVGAVTGPRHGLTWLAESGEMDFYDAKGVVEGALGLLGLDAVYTPEQAPFMQAGRTASVSCNGKAVGLVGEIGQEVLERFGLEGRRVAVFELDLESLHQAASRQASGYGPISRFPESERDVALIVGADVGAAQVQEIIERNRLVKSSTPFDLYSGEGVPAGKKSLAFRITYQSEKGTLTAEQIDHAQRGILRQLGSRLGAEIRV
jgi:phenylalanyl-tRNA synthetase beta chain